MAEKFPSFWTVEQGGTTFLQVVICGAKEFAKYRI